MKERTLEIVCMFFQKKKESQRTRERSAGKNSGNDVGNINTK